MLAGLIGGPGSSVGTGSGRLWCARERVVIGRRVEAVLTSNLLKRGFVSLLLTQFFGAANDNILKQVLIYMVATGLWAKGLGEGGQAYIAVSMSVPFILLSGFAGQIADRFSKRSVMIGVKLAEIPIAFTALIGLWSQDLWVTFAAFLMLSIQSSFFGPAKYGVVPELVEGGDLSRANGALNMFTNVAIIVGAMLAGPLADLYHPKAGAGGDPDAPVLWAPGVALVLVAALGLASILMMPRLRPGAPGLRYHLNPLHTYITSIREMARTPLLIVALAWGYFYLLGSIALLALPEYETVLRIDYTRTSYLIGMLGIAIGVGSVLCGLISGHHIKPRLIPVGAVGLSVCLLALGILRPTYWNVALLIIAAGVFAGFYIIPLQALLQKLSPDDERGRFLGTANALSWCFITLGSIVYWIADSPLGLPANRIFLVSGVLAVLGTGIATVCLWGLLQQHKTV